MSPVLDVLIRRYRTRKAGRRAEATRDLIVPFNDLLKEADSLRGTRRYEALRDLESLEDAEVLILERHARDRETILKVRLPLTNETAFFRRCGMDAPADERASLRAMFESAAMHSVPETFREGWLRFCRDFAGAAESGHSMRPFDRANPEQTRIILDALPRILAWPGESLMRFASVVLFGSSKTFESLRFRIESCLLLIAGKAGLSDFGILENERSFLIHGPGRLVFPNGVADVDVFESPIRLATRDLIRARIETAATHFLTVENAAMLYELAKLKSGVLLASSGSEGGFANSAVIELLHRLPKALPIFHFGDSDPKGFDILRDMRQRSGRKIASLHMVYRPVPGSESLTTDDSKTLTKLCASEFLTEDEKCELTRMREAGFKGGFEQESLGRPGVDWPYY